MAYPVHRPLARDVFLETHRAIVTAFEAINDLRTCRADADVPRQRLVRVRSHLLDTVRLLERALLIPACEEVARIELGAPQLDLHAEFGALRAHFEAISADLDAGVPRDALGVLRILDEDEHGRRPLPAPRAAVDQVRRRCAALVAAVDRT